VVLRAGLPPIGRVASGQLAPLFALTETLSTQPRDQSISSASSEVVALATALNNAFAGEHLDVVWSAIADEERSRLGALVGTAHEKALRVESETRAAAATAREREAAEAAERERQALAPLTGCGTPRNATGRCAGRTGLRPPGPVRRG
jgi:hypothetical protein